MSWDLKHKVLGGAAVVALSGAGWAFSAWLGSHDARIQAQAKIQAQAQIIRAEQQQRQQIEAEQQARDARTARQIAAMQAEVAKVKTAAQIAAWLPKQLPTPAPVKIEVPQRTAKDPTPAAVATIPQTDLPALRDYVESCQVCPVKLHTAQQDIADKEQQLKLAGEQLTAAEKQRDDAVRAARGTFWGRLWTRTKWFVIGAGAGAALLCGSGHCR
ncbi:MAG: hypothetical protein KGL59_09995 [Acidobacteriota bacterium]|nr:hypothetical protein [Acidobacteriota bacterium]